jgi:putative hemolysin
MKYIITTGIIVAIIGIVFFSFRAKQVVAPETQTPTMQIANPASVNCTAKGGKLDIKKRGDGGEYGVCLFEDNRQCEEWALFRGECPIGGRRITGYDSEEQIYCAIIGGATIAEPNTTCTLPNGKVCSNKSLFAGTCF